MRKHQAGILPIHLNSWEYVWGKEHINQNLSTIHSSKPHRFKVLKDPILDIFLWLEYNITKDKVILVVF